MQHSTQPNASVLEQTLGQHHVSMCRCVDVDDAAAAAAFGRIGLSLGNLCAAARAPNQRQFSGEQVSIGVYVALC